MTHHIDSPAFIANWRLLRVILQPDNMDQMEDMKRLLQQVLLLPAAAWCRLATTGVYRPPDCPSIVDRTSSIHSFFLPGCPSCISVDMSAILFYCKRILN